MTGAKVKQFVNIFFVSLQLFSDTLHFQGMCGRGLPNLYVNLRDMNG